MRFSRTEWQESVRPTWSSTPQSPAEAFAASLPLLTFSRPAAVSDDGDGAGLTSKPHRDRPAGRAGGPYVDRFACDWHRLAVGHPGDPGRLDDATTDPDGLHATTLVDHRRPAKGRAPDKSLACPGRRWQPPPGGRRRPPPQPPAGPRSSARWASRSGGAGGEHVVADHARRARGRGRASRSGPAPGRPSSPRGWPPAPPRQPGLVDHAGPRSAAAAPAETAVPPRRTSRAATSGQGVQSGRGRGPARCRVGKAPARAPGRTLGADAGRQGGGLGGGHGLREQPAQQPAQREQADAPCGRPRRLHGPGVLRGDPGRRQPRRRRRGPALVRPARQAGGAARAQRPARRAHSPRTGRRAAGRRAASRSGGGAAGTPRSDQSATAPDKRPPARLWISRRSPGRWCPDSRSAGPAPSWTASRRLDRVRA